MTPAGVVATYAAAIETGLAGGSIEDYDGAALYSIDEAAERVAAAVSVTDGRFVLTARAENHIRGNPDLADTIARLQRYQEAGADVLYAPGVVAAADVRTLLAEVDRPVNVLLLPGGASVAELADLGVSRISVGGTLPTPRSHPWSTRVANCWPARPVSSTASARAVTQHRAPSPRARDDVAAAAAGHTDDRHRAAHPDRRAAYAHANHR